MKTVIAILFFFTVCVTVSAQEYSFRYGKVTPDELQMDTYPQDTTANAIVIYKKGKAYYNYVNGGFQVIYEYETKMKVLSTDGTDYANITIPVYSPDKGSNMKENISRLEAVVYNMENGKTVETKLEKKYIFEERVSPTYKQVKFSLPNVKVGSVFEYKYRILSDFYYQLDDWEIQEEIPVVYSLYEIEIPEYYEFSQNSTGYESIEWDTSSGNQTFSVHVGSGKTERVNCSTTKLKYVTHHTPALKESDHIWCLDDFKTRISFELHGVQFPYSVYQPFASNWENIDKTLLEGDSWGKLLRMKNPFSDEMKALDVSNMTIPEKTSAIFEFVKEKMKWNGKYALTGTNTRQAIREGQGTNAEINFMLYAALKDAGLEVYPIVLSRKNQGRLPLVQPTISKLNTFILGVRNEEHFIFLDASTEYGGINVLAPSLMTDRARMIIADGRSRWVDLVYTGRNFINSFTNITVGEDGTLTGKRQTTLHGIPASSFKKQYYESKDSIEYLEHIRQEAEIQITDWGVSQMEKYLPQARETVEFIKTTTVTDNHIYFNPLIFPHITTNSFTEEERILPVEFSYPYDYKHSVNIILPEGYEVEELPTDARLNLEDGAIICQYLCAQKDNTVILSYIVKFERTLFTMQEYPALKEFWEMLVQKNTEQLVLKKIN